MRWLGLICRKFFDIIIESSKRLQSKISKELVDIPLIYCSIVNITLWKEEQKNENQINSAYTSCISNLSRSSNLGCSIRKGVFKKFEKFTGKPLCQRLFGDCARVSKETVAQSPKRLWHRRFPVNFVKFLKASSTERIRGTTSSSSG